MKTFERWFLPWLIGVPLWDNKDYLDLVGKQVLSLICNSVFALWDLNWASIHWAVSRGVRPLQQCRIHFCSCHTYYKPIQKPYTERKDTNISISAHLFLIFSFLKNTVCSSPSYMEKDRCVESCCLGVLFGVCCFCRRLLETITQPAFSVHDKILPAFPLLRNSLYRPCFQGSWAWYSDRQNSFQPQLLMKLEHAAVVLQ